MYKLGSLLLMSIKPKRW